MSTAAATTQPSRSGRFLAGDAIRGIACTVVVLWHVAVGYGTFFDPTDASLGLGIIGRPIYASGIFMVWIFFALSGYFLGGPFLRSVVRGDGRVPRVGGYALNRLLRIVPAFWLFITLTVLLEGTEGAGLGQMLAFYGFAHIYGTSPFEDRMVQAWTVDVEMVFYIAVPLLLLPLAMLLRGRWTPQVRAVALLALLGLIVIGSLSLGTRGPASWKSVPGAMWAFVPGMALATVEPLLAPRFRDLRIAPALIWVAVLTPVVLFPIYLWGTDHRKLENALGLVMVTGVIGGPLMWQWRTGGSWRILDNPVTRWVGVNSYGIYLSHLLVIQQIRPLGEDRGSTWEAVLLTGPPILAIAFLVGGLSFRYVETPFLNLRKAWRAAEPPPAAGPAATAERIEAAHAT